MERIQMQKLFMDYIKLSKLKLIQCEHDEALHLFIKKISHCGVSRRNWMSITVLKQNGREKHV